MKPEDRAKYSRAIRDEIIAVETEARLGAGAYLREVAQSEIRGAFSENNPNIDPTPLLSVQSDSRPKLQALENLLSAIRCAKPLKTIEAGAELTIEVTSIDEGGSLLEDIGGSYFYHEPKHHDPKPFNGLTQIPNGPKIMNRGSSLLSIWLFFLGSGEEFNFLDEQERNLHVKILEVD